MREWLAQWWIVPTQAAVEGVRIALGIGEGYLQLALRHDHRLIRNIARKRHVETTTPTPLVRA